jgi:hypothetical protein
MPMTLTSPSPVRKYPWELIFDGNIREVDLTQFGPKSSVGNFRAAASSAAKRRGLQVSVVTMGDRLVWVQAYDRDGGPLLEGIDSLRDGILWGEFTEA